MIVGRLRELETSRDVHRTRSLTAAYYLAFLGLGLMDASLGPTLPWLAERAGTHAEQLGVLFTTRSCGYVLGSYLAGRLYDRVPGHRVMVAGLLAMAAAMAPVPIVGSIASVATVLLFAGAGAGALDVGGNALLAWIHGDRVGPFLNGLHFCFGAGALLAPIVVAQALARGIGLQWTYWSIAALLALFTAFIAVLPSPPRRLRPEATEGNESPSHTRLTVLVGASLMAYVGVELGFGGWLFTYATSGQSFGPDVLPRTAMPPVRAAYLTSLYWSAFTVGRLVSIPVMAYLTRRYAALMGDDAGPALTLRRVLDATLAGTVVAVAILLFSRREETLWIGSLVLGFFLGPIFPTLIAVAEQRTKLSGQITSVFIAGAGLGGMFVPWGVGIAMHELGPGALLPAVAANLVILLALYWTMNSSLRYPAKA